MGETTTEYMHTVVYTIVFCSAIALLLGLLAVLKKFNNNEIEAQNNKAAITMDTSVGYAEDYIYVLGSEVYTDIINQDEDLPIYLNGTLLATEYVKNIKEGNKDYINDLKTRISFDDEYIIRHTYYSTNEIKAVYYEHK